MIYGFSLVLPYSPIPNYLALPFFSIILISLYVFSLTINLSVELILWIVIVEYVIYFFIFPKTQKNTMKFSDKLRVEKYYRVIIPSDKTHDYNFFCDAIRLHRKYGQYGEYGKNDKILKLRYLEDKELIKEYRRFNRKWEFIAIVYMIIHVIVVYLWVKVNDPGMMNR